MAAALRAAGCQEAWLGAESGSQRVLDAMNKGIRVPEIHSARATLGAAGIRVGFFIQLGYLGEELPTFSRHAISSSPRPDDVGVSVGLSSSGHRFHDLASAQLGEKTHWQASGELAMMFPGTYTTPFYREVRDLLHEQVRLSTVEALRNGADERAVRAAPLGSPPGRQESFSTRRPRGSQRPRPAVGLP